MTQRRLLVAGIAVLTVGQCFLWLAGATLTWTFRNFFAPPPAEVELRTRLALAEFAGLGLNVAGLLAFSLRPRGFGGWVLAGSLLCDVAATLFLTFVLAATDWWLGGVGAGVTLVLL